MPTRRCATASRRCSRATESRPIAWISGGLTDPYGNTLPAEGIVSFAAAGREAANSGLPLLEQAEDAGLAPDHGCRMGICNTCTCRKRAGTVRNIVTGEVSSAGEEQIRICVSVPLGDVALDL